MVYGFRYSLATSVAILAQASASGMLPCLIYVREGDRARLGPNKQTVPLSSRYTKYIRSVLFAADSACFEARGLTSRSKPIEYQKTLAPLDGHVVGIALLRPLFCSNCMAYLTESQHHLRRYWLQTKYSDSHFVYSHVVAAEQLLAPVPVRASILRISSAALFFETTEYSAAQVRRLPNGGLADGSLMI